MTEIKSRLDKKNLAGNRNIISRKYWEKRLKGLELSDYFKRTRPINNSEDNISYQRVSLVASDMVCNNLKEIANSDIAQLTVLISVLGVLAQRYSSNSEICIFTSVPNPLSSNKPKEPLIPVRIQDFNDQKYIEFLNDLKHNLINDFNNGIDYSPYRVLGFDEDQIDKIPAIVFLLEGFQNWERSNKVTPDLVFNFKIGERLSVCVEYNSFKFFPAFIKQIAEHYFGLLKTLINDKDQIVSNAQMLTENEKNRILKKFVNNEVSVPNEKTLNILFEEQVEKTPDNIALVLGSEKMTYKALNTKANKLAYLLRKQGVLKNTIIGLYTNRSIETIVGMLAILKSGGSYLPIDVDLPISRIQYLISDSGINVVLTTNDLIEKTPSFLIALSIEDLEKVSDQNGLNVPSDNLPSDLCYIIYTSGTTGNPKGVMIEHGNVVRLLINDSSPFSFSSRDVWTMFHSHCFDFSVWEMYGALLFGGQLIIIPSITAKDSELYLKILQEYRVTVLNQTPTAFLNLINADSTDKGYLDSLRYVIFGGEALQPRKLNTWRAKYPNVKLINMYGITETSVHVTYKEIKEAEIDNNISNIGGPLPSTSTYVLDSFQRLLPIGVVGELFVGGRRVSRGYLNNEELTSDRFIKNPFGIGDRLYRSGDLVRIMDSYDLEFLGRADNQVKIRGHRVELKGIEHALLKSLEISDCIVLTMDFGEDENELVAYFVSEEEYNSDQIRNSLGKIIPTYMIPAHYVNIKAIPLTGNGKIDIKSLPFPIGKEIDSGVKYVAPRNNTENKLIDIWEIVLKRQDIGIFHNFFALGGDSIKIIQVASRIKSSLGIALNIKDFYKFPTIIHLAQFIDSNSSSYNIDSKLQIEIDEYLTRVRTSVLASLPNPSEIEDAYPMNDIQKGMVFSSILEKDYGVYHNQLLFQVPLIDINIFRKGFSMLVKKHEILRTCFNLTDFEEEVQIVYKEVQEDINFADLTFLSLKEKNNRIKEYVEQKIKIPFSITTAPLWRVGIFKVNENEMVYLLESHHAILDGWSEASLNAELFEVCHKLQSDPSYVPNLLKCNYKKSVADIYSFGKNKENLDFWMEELKDYQRLSIFSDEEVLKEDMRFYDSVFLDDIKSRANKADVSVKSLFFTAYLFAIGLLTFEREITVGLVSNIRPLSEDGDKVLGCFLNTIPFKFDLSVEDSETWISLAKRVDEKIKHLIGRDRLTLFQISKLTDEKSQNGNPFFDTIFNFIDFHIYDKINENYNEDIFKEELELPSSIITNTYMDFSAEVTGGALQISSSLRRNLDSGLSIEDFMNFYDAVLKCLVKHPDGVIKKEEIPTKRMRKKVLFDFNKTEIKFSSKGTLVQIFEKQAQNNPDSIALRCEENSYTFSQLNAISNQLGGYLREHYSIVPNDLIGVQLQRTEWLIISIMGILKSGAAYVPIDIGYKRERVNFIKSQCNCKVVLNKIELKKFQQTSKDYSKKNLRQSNNSRDLAYIIFTSGSTGNPKGVPIANINVINLIKYQSKHFKVTEEDVFILFSSISFDASVEQIFLPLFNGASLYIPKIDDLFDLKRFETLLISQGITHLHAVPSFLRELTWNPAMKIKRIVSGGEIFHLDIFNEWKGKAKIYNEYGPTETTVTSIQNILKEGVSKTNIGRPIANTNCYILNENLMLQSIGVKGEIYIGGLGLTKGYLNLQELTNEKFISNPYNQEEILYNTGDIGRWLADGTIEFFGRNDNQVKIRGYRIELGEIEHHLLQFNKIKDAVVLCKTRNDENYLVGYYVSDKELDLNILRKFLSNKMPVYMVPSHYIHLHTLPLNSSGKTDKGALPEPEIKSSHIEPPTNDLEKTLVNIWAGVLRLETGAIGITDSFFDLGGNSLLLIRMVHSILKTIKVKVPLNHFYSTPRIKDLAKILKQTKLKVTGNFDKVIIFRYDPKEMSNLFIIHDGSGDITGYIKLVERIGNCNCFGLRFGQLDDYYPQNTNIEMISSEYVKSIKEIQGLGPYNIVGWSTGGVIAYEVAKQLENSDNKIKNLIIIDTLFKTVSKTKTLKKRNFSLHSEIKLLKNFVDKTSVDSIEELWDNFAKSMKRNEKFHELVEKIIPDNMKRLILDFRLKSPSEIISTINTIRTLDNAVSNYKVTDRIKGKVTYFHAAKSKNEFNLLSKLNGNVFIKNVEGDHFTIMEDPFVSEISGVITNLVINP